MATSDERAKVRVGEPGELLQIIPYLLGFRPYDSAVVVGLGEHRHEVVITARLDWADAGSADGRRSLAQALARAAAAEALVVVYGDLGPPGTGQPAPEDGRARLTADALVKALRETLDGQRIGCPIAMAVLDGRWRLLGPTSGGWPSEGMVVPDRRPSAALAGAIASGLAALPDRAAVEAGLAPAPAAQTIPMPVVRTFDPLDEAGVADAARLWLVVQASQSRGDWTVPDDVGGTLLRALRDVRVRDVVCAFAGEPEAALAESLARQLARRGPPPWCVPAYAVLGWFAWQRGDGVSASIAVDHALDVEPDYSLAVLLRTALDHALPPHPIATLDELTAS